MVALQREHWNFQELITQYDAWGEIVVDLSVEVEIVPQSFAVVTALKR